MSFVRMCRWALAGLVVVATSGVPTAVVAQRMESTGTVATGLLLRQMDGVKRVLMIGAHPDDEDTSLLATLARGWGVRTAYLSLTRGDGGQNLIGPELWEGLGIVRTGELLAARRLDGGEQFFTRAFDYGFSKSADEALTLWPREELLADVVWVIRTFRPQVVVSVFSGTPLDGHGQHQAAGIMAREAFAAAADPLRFPEQMGRGVEPWAPAKLYQTSRRRFFSNAPDEDDGSLDVDAGRLDPLFGKSLYQLAMESRSQHRSQDMGTAQPLGPRLTGVLLVESRVTDRSQALFSGIDTTLVGLAATLSDEAVEAARRHLAAYRTSLAAARGDLGVDPARITPMLLEARSHLVLALDAAGGARAPRAFRDPVEARVALAERAIMAAAGIVFDVRAADDLVVPGQAVEVTAQLWNGGTTALALPEVALDLPRGWTSAERARDGLDAAGALAPGGLATWTFEVRVPSDASTSRPYYLRAPRQGAWYRWPDESSSWGLPFDPAPVQGQVRFGFVGAGAGPRHTASAPWRFVGVNPAFGEFEKPVLVVPELSVSVAPSGVVWPRSRSGAQPVSVVVRSERDGGSRGTVSMEAPAGWTVEPETRSFDLSSAGAERAMTFDLRPNGAPAPGRETFRVAATTANGTRYDEGYRLIDYEHIRRTPLYAPAEASVSVVPLAVRAGLRVGYVMGSGDDGPEAIRQMGAEVVMLDEAMVRDGAFDGFTTIVLGVRAYETRPDLQAAAGQLMDFVRSGGTLVVQYNRGPLGRLAPYPLEVGRGSPRVADETAPVTVLEATAPVFTTPNPITQADFEGWVQERGLYFASEWDDRYVSLLEMHDAGEEPRLGSTLVASVGDGVFVYTALSFFRQWDGQVAGAYRLFANLISLDPHAWNAFEDSR